MNIQMAKKWPEMVVTPSFIKGHSFPITLYLYKTADFVYISESNESWEKYSTQR